MMGRTSRKRRRRKNFTFLSLEKKDEGTSFHLKEWLQCQNGVGLYNLVPCNFPITGRGLKTLRDIQTSEILIRLPLETLITTSTMSQCGLKNLFQNNETYSAQCVLSVFIIYENHLGINSKWYSYISTLPQYFTNPEFCLKNEKCLLPAFIRNSLYHSYRLKSDYSLLIKSMKTLYNINKNHCPHCGILLEKIVTYQKYQWAYYIVNTRAVYLDIQKNHNNTVNIKQPNNLALAPFLDLFNHDVNASVNVCIVTDDVFNKFYQITTLKPFKKGSQVFINYGSHNSLELYIEYGFFIPNNPLDVIYFDMNDIKACCTIPRSSLDFIMSNGFHKKMSFTIDGLSYNAVITLFILSTKLQSDYWNMKLYNESFNAQDLFHINNLGIKILHLKKNEFIQYLNNMEKIEQRSSSFLVAINLVKEYIKILNKSLECLKFNSVS